VVFAASEMTIVRRFFFFSPHSDTVVSRMNYLSEFRESFSLPGLTVERHLYIPRIFYPPPFFFLAVSRLFATEEVRDLLFPFIAREFDPSP